MKCPFRKIIEYRAGQNSGNGYPVNWIAQEHFDECIKEECMAYITQYRHYLEKEYFYCSLCNEHLKEGSKGNEE